MSNTDPDRQAKLEISNSLISYIKEKGAGKEAISANLYTVIVDFIHENKEHVREIEVLPELTLSKLRKLRKSKRLLSSNVENDLGWGSGYISHLETGKISKPSYRRIRTLFNYYAKFE